MKKLIMSSVVAATVLSGVSSADMKVGLGVDVLTNIDNPIASFTSTPIAGKIGSTPVVRVPIVFDALRVEPRLAYASTSNDQGGGTSKDGSLVAGGLGAYYTFADWGDAGMYAGANVDYYGVNGPDGKGGTTSYISALVMAASIGVEYFMVKDHFSVASELGFSYTSTTYPSGTGANPGTKDVKGSDINPVTSLTMRYYF